MMQRILQKPNPAATAKPSFSDFTNKLTAKWRLKTLPNAPEGGAEGKTTEDILRDLVAIPSISGNYETNHDALEYIDRYLRERSLYVKRLNWNGFEALVATTKRTKKPTVFLAGHIDVVPASEEQFKLQERDDKYYGRGVMDMKGAIAAYLGTVEELRDALQDYNFGIMIMTDEEVGGFDGAANLAKEGYLPKVMVLPDGGGNWNIERFAKGLWHLTIEATGKGAHGSRPWEGENAVDKLMDVIQEIKALFPKPSPEGSTINVGIIQGGHAINQIPSTATASMDIRYASEKDQVEITGHIKDMIESRGMKLTTEVHGDSMSNDPANPYLATYADCTERAVGHPVEWIVSNAASDGRWFAAKGVPCAISYPRGGNHHGQNEWISKEALRQMQSIFVDYIQHTAKVSKKPK